MHPIIHAQNLHKTYAEPGKAVHALKGVSLKIEKGESVAIMGPSGSGKSTLLHIFGCLDKPSSGFYHLDGKDVACLTDNELSRMRSLKIGFVFQRFNLIPQLTILANVTLPFIYQDLNRSDTNDLAQNALAQVGLGNRIHHKPNELSGGELQRAAIARALVTDPLIILADEPTGNLDSATAAEILALFVALNRHKRTVIIVTHNMQVANSCQRIVNMIDGKISHS